MIPWKSLVDPSQSNGALMCGAYDSKPMVALNSFTSPFGVSILTCGNSGQGSVRKPDPPTEGAEAFTRSSVPATHTVRLPPIECP